MSQYQKEQILALRESGGTFSDIAEKLGLSVNTVKSFYRRHNAKPKISSNDKAEITAESGSCPQCGNELIQIKGRKPKKFCSAQCRVIWWNSHSEKVRRKALYSFKCAFCGKDFTAYGNAKRRYCCHSFYCKDRFSRNTDDGKAAVI